MNTLTTGDIIIFFLTIIVTVGVGLIFKSQKKLKNDSINEYLLAGNEIGPFLTGVSICASMVSSIGLSVIPAEIVEGGVYVMIVSILSLGVSYILIQVYLLPNLIKHRLPSVYSLVKMQFGEKIYKFVLFAGLPSAVMLNALIMFTPALAIYSIFYNIPIQVLIIFTNLLVLFYTFIGGYSMVIVTDFVQCSIVILGMCYLAFLSVQTGFAEIYDFANDTGRLNYFGRNESLLKNFSLYVKEGTLSLLFPTLFIFLNRSYGQENIQRLLAVKGGIKSARKAHLIGFISFLIFSFACIILALSALTFTKNCDYKNIDEDSLKKDEIIPFFSTKLLQLASNNQKYPIVGFYLAIVYAGALSTTSSFLNSMSMLAITDIIPGVLPSYKIKNPSLVAKMALLASSILITIVSLIFSVASSNLFSVFMYINSLTLPVMMIPIVAILPFFGSFRFSRKSVVSASLISMIVALTLVCARNYDPPSKDFSGDYQMVDNCSFNRTAESIELIYQLPTDFSSGNDSGVYSNPNIFQMLYWASVPALSTITIVIFLLTANILKLVLKDDAKEYKEGNQSSQFDWIFK